MHPNLYKISYWWAPPVPEHQEPEAELALMLEQQRLPRIGQAITWLLPMPAVVGQEPPSIIALGEVLKIEKVAEEPDTYAVLLGRCHNGLSYEELCACINAQVAGFHPEFGCVEGRLVGLMPRFELAGIADPLLGSLLGGADDDDEPVVWVNWATVWTVEGLELMAQQEEDA